MLEETDSTLVRAIMLTLQRSVTAYIAVVGYYAVGVRGFVSCLLGSAIAYTATSSWLRAYVREKLEAPFETPTSVPGGPEDDPNWPSYRP